MTRCFVCLPLLVCLAYFIVKNPLLPGDTFVDPDNAGPDFATQGEYEGKVGEKGMMGVQVVALGRGKFNVFFLPGGLPCDGRDGKTRIKATAKSEGNLTTVEGQGWTGEIAKGKLTVKSVQGTAYTLPRVVRKSSTEGAKPPGGAKVLFDGSGAAEWKNGKLVEEKLLAQGATTVKKFKDFKLHVEFRLPFRPLARGQSRGNSGVYLQQRYEIQILDSFGVEATNDECAAVYTQAAPSVNVCYPPLSWQTFDIDFTAARFDAAGKKTANAVVTVLHNGVRVQDAVEIKGSTGHGEAEADTPGPIYLQNHNNPVYFRNIWVVQR
jgi:hypothetical protein